MLLCKGDATEHSLRRFGECLWMSIPCFWIKHAMNIAIVKMHENVNKTCVLSFSCGLCITSCSLDVCRCEDAKLDIVVAVCNEDHFSANHCRVTSCQLSRHVSVLPCNMVSPVVQFSGPLVVTRFVGCSTLSTHQHHYGRISVGLEVLPLRGFGL